MTTHQYLQRTFTIISIENKQYGDTVIVVVSATHSDKENGKIAYDFGPETSTDVNSLFALNKMIGYIFLQQNLPTNQNPNYKLLVEATNGGHQFLRGFVTVLINTTDRQNRAPNILCYFHV